MKIKFLKKIKSVSFMDTINLYMEIFPHDWDYIPVIRRLLNKNPNKNRKLYLLVAEENKRIIGGCLYSYWKDTKLGLLEYLFVKQNMRSKGIGSKLYLKMQKELKKKNCKHLIFNIANDKNFKKSITEEEIKIRQRRLKFYEKLGARPINHFIYENPLRWCRIQEDYHPSYLAMDSNFSDKIIGGELYKIVRRFYKRFYYGANSNNNKIARKILKSINKKIDYNLRPITYIKK